MRQVCLFLGERRPGYQGKSVCRRGTPCLQFRYMRLPVEFVRFRPGLWVVVLLAAHMLFAAFAPCPLRAMGPAAQPMSQRAAHPHAGHVHAAPTPERSEPCPYALMHALFGVFKPARPSEPRQTCHQPLIMAVTTTSPRDRVALPISLDPPPRSSNVVRVSQPISESA